MLMDQVVRGVGSWGEYFHRGRHLLNHSPLLIVIFQVLSVCCDISQMLSVLHQAECVYVITL